MSTATIIRVLIIDDEPAIRNDIEWMLSCYSTQLVVVGACGCIQDAKVLIPALEPDILLLDIKLSDGTGFDLLALLPSINFQIVFITAYDQFAIKAIKYGALDYLLKPIDKDELQAMLAKAVQRLEYKTVRQQLDVVQETLLQIKAPKTRIALRSQQYLQVVLLDEIMYCQNDANYTTFYLTEGRKTVVSKSIKDYEQLLPEIFLRCHQSYLVNQNFVERYHKDGFLVLKNNIEIPVSIRKRELIIQILTQG